GLRGQGERGDAGDRRLGPPRGQVEAGDRAAATTGRAAPAATTATAAALRDVERTGAARLEPAVVARRQRQRHDALANIVQVRPGWAGPVGALAPAAAAATALGLALLLVALRGQRRGHVLVEHGQVNTARDRVVGAGHVDAVGGRADVGAGGEVQVLAAA